MERRGERSSSGFVRRTEVTRELRKASLEELRPGFFDKYLKYVLLVCFIVLLVFSLFKNIKFLKEFLTSSPFLIEESVAQEPGKAINPDNPPDLWGGTSSNIEVEFKECGDLKEFKNKWALFNLPLGNLNPSFYKLFGDCQKDLSNVESFLIDFYLKGKKYLNLSNSKKSKALQSTIDDLKKIKKKYDEIGALHFDWANMAEELVAFLKIKEKKHILVEARRLEKKLELSKHPLLQNLFLATLYFKVGNKSLAKRKIANALATDLNYLYFYRPHIKILKKVREKKFLFNFDSLINYTLESIDDAIVKKIFSTYWIEYFPEMVLSDSKLRKEKMSLFDTREFLSDTVYSVQFPWFFYYFLKGRGKMSEANSLLNSCLKFFELEKNYAQYTWVFDQPFMKEESSIKKLVSVGIKLEKSESLEDQALLLRLLGNQQVGPLLKKELKEYNRPLFILQRSFYSQLLNGGKAVDYAIQRLISLGEEKVEFLLWALVLNE